MTVKNNGQITSTDWPPNDRARRAKAATSSIVSHATSILILPGSEPHKIICAGTSLPMKIIIKEKFIIFPTDHV